MKKTNDNFKLFKPRNALLKDKSGITLIALVITIIVLLILAAVSINAILGENGLVEKAMNSKEKTAMAQIKERAELLKGAEVIDVYGTSGSSSAKLERDRLAAVINQGFSGSTMNGNIITTEDGKYDIIVRSNLAIEVVKHGEGYLKTGEMEITAYVPEGEAEEKTIELYFEVGRDSNQKTFEVFAEDFLNGKSTETLEMYIVKSLGFVGTFDEWLTVSGATRDELTGYGASIGYSYHEYLEYSLIYEIPYSWLYTEWLVYLIGGNQMNQTELENLYVELIEYNGTFDDILSEQRLTRDTFLAYVQEEGFNTEEDFIKALISEIVYQKEYEKIIVLTLPDGTTTNVRLDEGYAEYTVTENGDYYFSAIGPNGEFAEISVNVNGLTGVVPKVISIAVEKEGGNVNLTVDAANTDKYQFKVNDGEYSAKQASNKYSFEIAEIESPEGKYTGSSTEPYIPAGFVHTEGTVDTGYVITDLPEDYIVTVKVINEGTNKESETQTRVSGNEFVWVPVYNFSDIYDETNNSGQLWNFSGTTSSKKSYDESSNREPGIISDYDNLSSNLQQAGFSTSATSSDLLSEMQDSFDEMMNSIEYYGGFYIGRYETGDLSKPQAVVQKNNADTGRQTWYTMYKKCKTIVDTVSVKTHMIWGCQWDATLRWMQTSTNAEVVNYPTNSTGKGNHNMNPIIPTGSNESYSANNIYDMAGNVAERTMEAYSTSGRPERGGDYQQQPQYPSAHASYRNSDYSPQGYWSGAGCRAVLYMIPK